MSNLLKSKFILGLIIAVAVLVSTSSVNAAITSTLKFGSRGAQVTELQQALNVSPATGYFGNLTKAAVKAFQANKGLVADGVFGAKSRAALSGGTVGNLPTGCTSTSGFSPVTGTSCASVVVTTTLPVGCTTTTGFSSTTGASCATGVVTTTATGPIAVSLASDNPAAGNIISGQATADLAHFTFTGTGTVTQVTLQRTGISNSSSLTNLYLYDGVTRLTDSSTVNTNGVISFNGLNLAVSGSRTVAVKADVAGPTPTGSTIAVNLTSYTVLGGTANTVNVAGNTMYIQDGTNLMASAVVATNTVAASSVSAGTMSYTLWSSPVTVSTRAVSLKGASFKFIGSAPATAFANLKLFANGTQIATSTGVNSLSYVVFDLSSTPFTMNTGSTTLEVRGDVINGSYRDGKLSLENASDLMMTDPQLNINIAATGIPQTGATPGKITILQGSLISQVDTSFNALTTVTGGATNATIAKYKLTAYGEDMKVSQVIITPVLANMVHGVTTSNLGLLNVTLYWNGGQVGSSQNITAVQANTADLTYTLGSNLIVPAGTTGGILEVRADMQTAGSVNYISGTITVSGSIAIGQAQGVGSNGSSASYQTNAAAVPLAGTNGLSVSTAVLGISASTSYPSQTLSPNQTGVKIASFSVQNQGSSEGLRFTNLAVGLVEGDGATALTSTPALTNFTNLRISETSGVGTIGSPTATNNFPVDFTLASGTSKTIDVFADLGADSTNDFVVTLLPTLIGASSNVTLTPGAHTDGQVITMGTGTFNGPSLVVSSSTASQYIAGGASGVADITKTSFTILATSGTANISELKFSVSGSTPAGVTKIKVGSVSADVIGGIAILPVSIVVPNGQGGVTIDAYASYSPVAGTVVSGTASTIALTSVKYTLGGTTTTLAAGSYLANYVSGTLTGTGVQTITFNSTAKIRPGMIIKIFDSTDVDFSTPAIGTVVSVSGATASINKSQASEATGGASANSARFVSVPGNEMTLVGSKPTVTVVSPVNGLSTLAAGNVEAIDVKVTADAAGPITVNSFDITSTLNSTGGLFTNALATVQNLAGGSIPATGTCAANITCAITVTLTGGYTISAGQSETFRVFLPVTTVATTVSSPNNSMGTKLVSGATFVWTDTQGGASSTATGALIYNYPTSTTTVHN